MQQFFAAIWAGLAWLGLAAQPAPATFQGYVEGEFVLMAPTLAGPLQTLAVRRGAEVQAGDLLFALDLTDEKAARDQAQASLDQARAQLANLAKAKRRPEIEAIEAQIAQAQAQARLDETEYNRQKAMLAAGASSRDQYDQAKAALEQETARVKELAAQLTTAQLTLGREDELRGAADAIAANEAAVAQAQWRLDQKTVAAPASGLIADTYFNPGEMIAAGQPVVSLLPPGNIKVRFFVPEESLASLPVGASVIISCDGCPAQIPATVRFVSPQSEYTPPVLYNRDNRNRIEFMIEAWPTKTPQALRPGQPVDVTLVKP